MSIERSSKFSHDRMNKKFMVDKSEIGKFHEFWGRDGLVMVSDRTDCSVYFEISHHTMVNGELTKWVLIPTRGSLDLFPQMEGYELIVFNT